MPRPAVRVKKPTKEVTRGSPSSLLSVMKEGDGAAPVQTLDVIRNKVREARLLEAEIADLGERASTKRRAYSEILNKTLPDMMTSARVPSISVAAEGNLPEVEVKVQKYYTANISADWEDERREEAFDLLKKEGAGDLIKMSIIAEFAMGTSKLQKQAMAALRKLKVGFSVRKMAPHSALAAWIRERYDRGAPLSTKQLEILGASVGSIARLKPVKQK